MKSNIRLEGKKTYLKILEPQDVGNSYLEWLNNKEINQYLEVRFSPPKNLVELREFVSSMFLSSSQYMFGIFDLESNLHIGNIKIGDISNFHSRAEVGLIIGDKNSWGRGVGSEAISLVTKFAFENLKLNRLYAGSYSNNQGSINAFLKNNFIIEGKLHKHFKLNSGEYVDSILMGKLNESK